ncbi:MAG: hypothetical protein LBT62_04960, partial [Deltaproteobacteria bacterium]|nr:hypothetical protein [Deltaproteobacteria bacterium]
MRLLAVLKNGWKLVGLVFSAFLIMTLASYYYVSTVMKSQIDLHSRSELMMYQASLRNLVQANEDALMHSSAVITMNLENDASLEDQLATLRNLNSIFSAQQDIKNVFLSVYGYLDGSFLDNSGIIAGAFFNPKTAPWFRGALLTTEIYHTEPSIDPRTGK